MLLTSSEANKLVKTYLDELQRLHDIENQSSIFTVAVTENVEDVRPVYSFETTQARFCEINAKIRKVKHAINVFNTTTVLNGFDMTIDEALVYLPQLTNCLSKLSHMATKLPKSRACNRYSSSNVIEYEYTNYAPEDADAFCVEIRTRISKLQTALDTVNNTVQFSVDID